MGREDFLSWDQRNRRRQRSYLEGILVLKHSTQRDNHSVPDKNEIKLRERLTQVWLLLAAVSKLHATNELFSESLHSDDLFPYIIICNNNCINKTKATSP